MQSRKTGCRGITGRPLTASPQLLPPPPTPGRPASGRLAAKDFTRPPEGHGGGHTWPGRDPVVQSLLGKSTKSISANDLMWEFFKRHPMK